MEKIKYFEKNDVGTDYIVGDIHGCFDKLIEELKRIGFNKQWDRLFFVGDLVDRGPDSPRALAWLQNKWFNGVRGNHEDMAISYGTYLGMDYNTYSYNGGDWFLNLEKDDKQNYINAFKKLPLMLELKTTKGTIGIVHAECIDNSWTKSKEYLTAQPAIAENVLLWGRDKIRRGDKTEVEGIDFVVVGHTPLKQSTTLGNVIYIDTGACFEGKGHFTIINADTLEVV